MSHATRAARIARTFTAFALALLGGTSRADPVTFRVAVPATTTGAVYIAGDFQGWNPGSAAHALTQTAPDLWQITLDLPAGPIQFKFTRGSWATVEKGPGGEEIANRTATVSGPATLDLTVAGWADGQSSTITGDVTTHAWASFLSGRRVWVYLPPGYHDSSRRYPVLYMHDGQNLFDASTSFAGEWKADETAETLIATGQIEPLIIVGIDNGPNRIDEYTPWSNPGFGGGGADAYLASIRDGLIPLIDAAYRTRTGPASTFIGGSSLGGLVSAYAGFEFADTFGRVAAVSPSYWWADGQMIQHAAQTARPPTLDRFYQDMGTGESGIGDLRAMRDALLARGFTLGQDLLSVEAPGHTHNETFWALRLPGVLRFLVGPPCEADLNADGLLDNGDLGAFVQLFLAGDLAADFNADGFLDNGDIGAFIAAFLAGC